MKTKLLLVTAVLVLPFSAIAEDGMKYQCALGDLQRRIEVLYETGMALPCEVHYYKDTEAPGESQVLWRAANEGDYCEAQARGLAEKLQGLGWDCGLAETDSSAPSEPAELENTEVPLDDTEELEPASEAATTE